MRFGSTRGTTTIPRRPRSIARSAQDDQLAADLWDISGELVDGAPHR